MVKKSHIKKYSAKELADLVKAEGSGSDWAKAEAMTYEGIAAAVASDPDEDEMIIDWNKATIEMPRPKAVLNMRIDKDILDYFRKAGKGYQTKINAVLRSYVEQKAHHHS